MSCGFSADACGNFAAELNIVDYTPIPQDEWPVSAPEEQGLDPEFTAEAYYTAGQMENDRAVMNMEIQPGSLFLAVIIKNPGTLHNSACCARRRCCGNELLPGNRLYRL